MLSQYTLTFQTECPTPRQEWAYPLYASLLERLPASVGIRQHDGERTGVSQFVRCVGDGRLVWQVSLLGEEAEEIFSPILEEMDCCTLRRSTPRCVCSSAVCSVSPQWRSCSPGPVPQDVSFAS